MQLDSYCNGESCVYKSICSFSNGGKREVKCPVYHFNKDKSNNNSKHPGVIISICPSCGKKYDGLNGLYYSGIWGVICGYCLYEFKEKGYPTIQSFKLLKDRGFDRRSIIDTDFQAWDIYNKG